jgi:GntR family transcriptional regulator
MPVEKLDRRSAVPLYFQLQEALREELELGTWRPGEEFPSETQLCDDYQVSRTVVRQALSILEQDGQIQRSRGRRSTVAPPKAESRAGGVSRLLALPRSEAGVVVLSLSYQQASRRICDQLWLSPGATVVRMMSLLELGGGPLALFDSWLPVNAAESLTDILPSHLPAAVPEDFLLEVRLAGTRVSIETSSCSRWEADRLQIPYRGPVFVTSAVETRTSQSGDVPVEVARGVYRADRVQFTLEFAGAESQAQARWQLTPA